MNRYRHYAAALLAASPALLFAGAAKAGSWSSTTAATANGGAPFNANLPGDLYTPSTPAADPAILVVIHMCSGNNTTVHGWFDSFADTNGFYLIAPDAGFSGSSKKDCFDSSATRAAGSDPDSIVTMVKWVLKNKNANPQRVFAAGMSSGGCMTNTLVALYPEVFSGGAAMPGFPAGGWPSGDTTCTKCGTQPPSTSGSYWANIVTTANPGFKGEYGCLEEWAGGGDQYDFEDWFPAIAAQWETLGGLGAGAAGTGAPSGWTREVYKDSKGNVRLETNLGPSGQKHDLETVMPTLYSPVVTFLGLDKATGGCGLATTSVQDNESDGGASGASGASGSTSGGTDSGVSGSASGSASGTSGKSGSSGTTGSTGSSGTGTTGTGSTGTGSTGTGSTGTGSTGTGSTGTGSTGTASGSSGSGSSGSSGSSSGSSNTGSGSGSNNSGSGSGSNSSGSTNSGSDDNGGGSKSSGCSMIPGGPAGAGTGVMFAVGLLGLAFGGRRRRRS